MRKLLPAIAALGLTFGSFEVLAQTNKQPQDTSLRQAFKDRSHTVQQDIKEGVEKASDKTAEIAVKGAAIVSDQIYKDKTGPDGQTIYIDEHSRYYWVNDKGGKVYIAKDKLRDKKD